jgi:hypothetical protein
MIDFNTITVPNDLSISSVLSRVDESQIFSYYFGYFELRKLYPSKLRRDRKPSTSFFVSTKSGNILYKDFATNEVFNCFTFVARMYNVSFREALAIIAKDFGLIPGTIATTEARTVLENVSFDKEIKSQTLIQVIPAQWEPEHIEYWNSYHISVDKLKANDVYPVRTLFVNKAKFSTDKLCFAYLVKYVDSFGEYHEYLKIYQPQRTNENGKWINNVPISVPFGLYDLKPSGHIVVGKAKKDEMVLQHFFTSTIGTQNESESALAPPLVSRLHEEFPKRTIIWDSDQTGVENCKKFNDKGFGYFNTPAYLVDRGIKDVSDYVKAFGMKAFERLLKSKNII